MRICQECGQEFETFQAKANHVRWKHKDQKYSEDGLRRLKESVSRTNSTRHGPKTFLTEKRICKCGKEFETTFSPERRHRGKITCSKFCAARRVMSEKGKESIRKFHKENPHVWQQKGLYSNNNRRRSSKAERALALALQPHGYQRHLLIRTQDIRFDVDIVSRDQKVWIESDGSWHFKKIHEGHNFETTQLRDKLEEVEAINRGVLLIRVNNEASTVEEQVQFILDQVESWDKATGKVVKFRHPNL